MAIVPEICPNCGVEVPSNVKACPECGSCEETGWSDEAHADRLGLPDENFNYDDYVKREFGHSKSVPRGMSWFWWIVGILVLAAMLIMLFH